MRDQPKKKKRRTLGQFPCLHCDKVFTRLDHLSRHNLNHEPKELFTCDVVVGDYDGVKKICGKTFVRRDLKERHMRRHMELGRDDPPGGGGDGSVAAAPLMSGIGAHGTHSPHGAPLALNTHQGPPGHPGHPAHHHHHPAHHHQPHPNHGPLPAHDAASHQQVPHHPLGGQPVAGAPPLGQTPPLSSISARGGGGFGAQTLSYHQYPGHQGYMPAGQGMQHNTLPTALPMVYGYPHVEPQNGAPPPAPGAPPPAPSVPGAPAAPLSTAPPPAALVNPQEVGDMPLLNYDILLWLFDLTWLLNDPGVPKLLDGYEPMSALPASGAMPGFAAGAPGAPGTPVGAANNSQIATNSATMVPPLTNPQLRAPSTQPRSRFALLLAPKDVFVYPNPLDDMLLLNAPAPLQTNLLLLPQDLRELPLLGHTPKRHLMDHEPMAAVLHRHATELNIPSNKAWYVNDEMVDAMQKSLLPLSINRHEAAALFPDSQVKFKDRLLYYLWVYWQYFHKQFPILHQPLFDAQQLEMLLVVAMIMAGCHIGNPFALERAARKHRKSQEFELAMEVAKPLRMQLFLHPDFSLPTKLWVLQTLALLEFCEKNCLTKEMHERARIHHHTTAQILKRSPRYGGGPIGTMRALRTLGQLLLALTDELLDQEQAGSVRKDELFAQWVQLELMKRVTYMMFYIDTADLLKFRHDTAIQFGQLQAMKLPCDPEVWEHDVAGLFAKVVKRQRKRLRGDELFLLALKRLLRPGLPHQQPQPQRSVDACTRKVLFAGLVLLMNQMQLMDEQNQLLNLMDFIVHYTSWRDTVCRAFDRWYCLPPVTKLFTYHLSQIVGLTEIDQYEIAVFCGSADHHLMVSLQKEFFLIQRKLTAMWLKPLPRPISRASLVDKLNHRGIVHCWWLLRQLFEGHQPQVITWNLIDVELMYAVLVAVLTLWSWAYCTKGPELHRYDDFDRQFITQVNSCDDDTLEELEALGKELATAFITRLGDQFADLLRRENAADYEITVPYENNQVLLHDKLDKYAELLPQLTDHHHVAGLCFLVGTKLLGLQWDIVRENAKLIIHCGLRLIGKKEMVCDSLYDCEL